MPNRRGKWTTTSRSNSRKKPSPTGTQVRRGLSAHDAAERRTHLYQRGAAQRWAAQLAYEEQKAKVSAYERQNRTSGHGMQVVLEDGSVFWSRGWKGCQFGCGKRVDDWSLNLRYSEERRGGTIVRRWFCH